MDEKICIICAKVFTPKEKRRRRENWGLTCGKKCGIIFGWRERKRIPVKERFLKKILIGDGCWEWIGTFSHGYAVINDNKPPYRNIKAGKFSYELFVGPMPVRKGACHTCDNPRCVRFSHIFPGTQKENMEDAKRKGRTKINAGERNPSAKLTWDQVKEIRYLALEGYRNIDLARRFGVHDATITQIIKGQKWKGFTYPAMNL